MATKKELEKSLTRLLALTKQIDKELFHYNYSIEGYHLNGSLEPVMNFVADYDMEAINEAEQLLSTLNR